MAKFALLGKSIKVMILTIRSLAQSLMVTERKHKSLIFIRTTYDSSQFNIISYILQV